MLPAYAPDYAWLVDCCTRLAELTGEERWLDEAVALARAMLDLFTDDEGGGLYTTGNDQPPLVVRPRDYYDGVTPAAGSTAAVALLRLAALTGDEGLRAAGERIVAAVAHVVAAAPAAFGELLLGLQLAEDGTVEVAVGAERPDLAAVARRSFVPGAVVAWGDAGRVLLEGRQPSLAYVCHRGTCLAPVDAESALEADLARAAAS